MILTYSTTEAGRRRAACALALALAAAAGCGGALNKSPDDAGGVDGGGGGACGRPACGNDVAELVYCTNDEQYVEDCDGTDLRHSTCQSRGYIDGTLTCEACFFDESNCTTCAPLDAQLLSCTPKVQAGQGIALAATDTEVAIAWQQDDTLWFQRLAPDLSDLSTSGAAVRIADSAIGALDLIATPTGWLLADFTDSVRVFALDRQGAPASTVVLAQDQWPPDTDGDVWVRLVAGANGPIVIWLNATSALYTLYDAALSADGTTVRAQQPIGPLGGRSFAAAPLGDGLLVAAPFSSTLDLGVSAAATLVTDADGKPLGPPTAIDRDLDLPALAPTADGGAVMIFQDGVTPMWKKLDATGAIQSGPIALATTENIFGEPVSLVPLGGDRFMILTPNIVLGSIRTTLLWMDGAGNLSGSPKTIEANPQTDAIRGARSGSNVVVAWNLNDLGTLLPGHESFGLALVAAP